MFDIEILKLYREDFNYKLSDYKKLLRHLYEHNHIFILDNLICADEWIYSDEELEYLPNTIQFDLKMQESIVNLYKNALDFEYDDEIQRYVTPLERLYLRRAVLIAYSCIKEIWTPTRFLHVNSNIYFGGGDCTFFIGALNDLYTDVVLQQTDEISNLYTVYKLYDDSGYQNMFYISRDCQRYSKWVSKADLSFKATCRTRAVLDDFAFTSFMSNLV